MGALQTDDKYQGKGYGSLVFKALTKSIAEMGQDTYSAVNETNLASRGLLEKLGATSIGYTYCIVTENAWKTDTKTAYLAKNH